MKETNIPEAVGGISVDEYDYDLPDERIAKHPVNPRDSSKLLVYRGDKGIEESRFSSLASYLPSGTLLVFNNTKVIRARLHFRKETGALIEIFCLDPHKPAEYVQMFAAKRQCTWLCLVGNAKKWKEGALVRSVKVGNEQIVMRAMRGEVIGTSVAITFEWEGEATFAELLEAVGELPIPPYLNRNTEASDLTDYQTIYAKVEGSVAAPTAGLHFTPDVMQSLSKRGVSCEEVTLHVGAGTFKPVKSADISGHAMHTEWIAVRCDFIERLIAAGCSCAAVGTTSVRTLESLYYIGRMVMEQPDADENMLTVEQWTPYTDATPDVSTEEALQALLHYMTRHGMEVLRTGTRIIIAPSYRFRVVQMMITNFHQPRSTLLLLVSAFIGERWRDVYDYALQHDFRFLSYGDSSLLIP